jgi:flagellar hook-associated protein 1 FlgK
MSGLINALHIGKSSLLDGQKAIEVTGNNIANVNTEGYSRQIPVFSDYPTLNMNGFMVGRGSKIDIVDREHDNFLAKMMQEKNAALGEEQSKSTALNEIERIISISENGLSASIDNFFGAWQDLSADPGSRVARDLVLQTGEQLAQDFQVPVSELTALAESMNTMLQSRVDDLNLQAKEVAALNLRISTIESTGQPALADRDKRDLLLQEITGIIGGTNTESAGGMVSIFLPNGLPLVQGATTTPLITKRVGDTLQVSLDLGSHLYDLSADRVGGEMRGLMYLRDDFIPEKISELDKLAYAIVSEVNALHAAGTGLDGVSGREFFTPLAEEAGAAGFIRVGLQGYKEIAAGTSSASGDNTNALQLSALASARVVDGNETFIGYYARIAGDVGVESSRNKLALTGNQDALTQVANLRDNTVGVSLEEEMISLIKYQKSFEASAKYLSTVDEMMSSLLTIRG